MLLHLTFKWSWTWCDRCQLTLVFDSVTLKTCVWKFPDFYDLKMTLIDHYKSLKGWARPKSELSDLKIICVNFLRRFSPFALQMTLKPSWSRPTDLDLSSLTSKTWNFSDFSDGSLVFNLGPTSKWAWMIFTRHWMVKLSPNSN